MGPQFFCIAPDAVWLSSLEYLSLQYSLLTVFFLVSRLGVGQMELQVTKAINFEMSDCKGRKACKETALVGCLTAVKEHGIVSSRIPGTNSIGCVQQERNHGKAEKELLFTSGALHLPYSFSDQSMTEPGLIQHSLIVLIFMLS